MTDRTTLSLDHLLSACAPGGSTSLLSETELEPAGGPGAVIAPARVLQDGRGATFAFETRMERGDDGAQAPVWTVVVDSKQSVSNRDEDAIVEARRDGSTREGAALRKVPSIEVAYGGQVESDLTLPHRAFDAHIRSASLDGVPVTQSDVYRALRNATRHNARPLLEAAPTSLVLGAWDSTRKSHQGRYQTCLTGEVIGVLTDQDHRPDERRNRRAAARVDPVAASVKPSAKDVEALVKDQAEELSDKLQAKILSEAKKKGDTGSSMSTLGLGNIPPSLGELGGVACRSITRRRLLSFAALRQLRFGGTTEADVASRALLAAYGLLGMSLSDRELHLRANCHLREKGEPAVTLDQRYGKSLDLAPIDVETAVEVFEQALAHAKKVAGVEWSGQTLSLVGNPIILGAATSDDADEA
ncbi:type I-G CRISPR-associated RAMP protein Csb1/Cas7g [Micrococcus lylae]|uniref:Type I-U CRISPR-associated protein Cas7 n=1 Tax=Micrococcus lylae TaxID=1273 RepID=A0ABY2K2A8_9MICC|nr:type I-U CRISPR-associated RAMP protein Csb1/Cas7u [Micrococcus lylae]TFH98462.1 type I-U CRISPR-associated protein Cas7 [Micrococcus lylae]